MSSVSMIINDCGKTISGSSANPSTLNKWLKSNGGYASGNLFVWGSVATYGLSYVGKVSSSSSIDSYHNKGYAVILNVNSGRHWVLLTGISGSSYLVNDPGYTKTSYGKSEVVSAGVYKKPSGCKSSLS